MRVITLNVNGLRSAERKGLARWLARAEPWDIVCVQEIKCLPGDVPKSLAAPRGSHATFHPAERKGYAGVALYSKVAAPTRAGFGHAEFDAEGRYLQADFRDVSIVIASTFRRDPAASTARPPSSASSRRSCRISPGSSGTAAKSSCAATGTSRTSRSTFGTGAATRRTRASCPRSARGFRRCSTSLASSTSSAASMHGPSSTRGGRTAARPGRRTSAGASITRSRRRGSRRRRARHRSTRTDAFPITPRSSSTTTSSFADASRARAPLRPLPATRATTMIRISNLTLARGNKRLLEAANLTVHVGHKVGIVGANGCGKSSLFAAIRGELLPDAGTSSCRRDGRSPTSRRKRRRSRSRRSSTFKTGTGSCATSSGHWPPRARRTGTPRAAGRGSRAKVPGRAARESTAPVSPSSIIASTRSAATVRVPAPRRCSRGWASTSPRRRVASRASPADGGCA